MPRDTGTGVYTTPIGTDAIPNRTFVSTAYNLNVHDVELDLNTPRPISAGGTGASTAAGALKNLGAMPATGVGQCYLSKVSPVVATSPLILRPENGNLLWINGNVEIVPDAGVQLAPAGNASNTYYYIYAYMNPPTAGVMTLEYSTTPYAVAAGNNVKIKTGDPTRTLVGLSLGYLSNDQWSTYFTTVASLFNPKAKTYTSINVPAQSTSSLTTTQIAAALDIPFCTFADREVTFRVHGRMWQSIAGSSAFLDAIQDATLPAVFVTIQGATPMNQPADTNWHWMAIQVQYFITDTFAHKITPSFCTSGGTVTFNGGCSVTIQG